MTWPPVPSGVRSFPDVDEDDMDRAGQHFHDALRCAEDAKAGLVGVTGTGSWRSPAARPGWDQQLEARAGDLMAAGAVADHAGNVLRKTASGLRHLRGEYDAAAMWLFLNPDPTTVSDPLLPGAGPLLRDPPQPGPGEVRAWNAHIKTCNDAVSDAEFLIANAAEELMGLATSVTFATPPPLGSDPPGVDPKTGVIVPLSPAFGSPTGAVYANGVPIQFPKGQNFERSVLRDLGIGEASKDFYRPTTDEADEYDLPFTKGGRLARGTFPDSTRAGMLEIKSGSSTEINMTSDQLRVQRYFAQKTGTARNIVLDGDTPIDPDLVEEIHQEGGAVYRRVPGDDIYQNLTSGRFVRLQGGQGAGGRDLVESPVTPEEEQAARTAIQQDAKLRFNLGRDTGPEPTGPSEPYTTEQDVQKAWEGIDPKVTDDDTPPDGGRWYGEDGAGDPVAPEGPVAAEPVEPVVPIEPEPVEPVVPEVPEIPFIEP